MRVNFRTAFVSLLLIHSISIPGKSFQITRDTLVVNFISIGAGTDRRAKEKLSVYLKEFQSKNKIRLAYRIEPWGKEGESKYIFNLRELPKTTRAKFIQDVNSMFENNKLVTVTN